MIDIFQVLKSSNQELFYSAFLAWLLDSNGAHGLGNQFACWLLHRLEIADEIDSISTEKRPDFGPGRMDILITTASGTQIGIENKTKSICSAHQIEGYRKTNCRICMLGLIKENYPREIRNEVITYSEILSAIRSFSVAPDELSVLTIHFTKHLERILQPFEIMRNYCSERIDLNSARHQMSQLSGIRSNENDKRFFHVIYFERLVSYLEANEPDLIFGHSSYWQEPSTDNKPYATAWQIEKNLQGPAFCESLIYSKDVPGKIRISQDIETKLSSVNSITMAPRLELTCDQSNIFTIGHAGKFQIGCWDKNLNSAMRSLNIFTYRGPRNFHMVNFGASEMTYRRIARLMRTEMSKIWDFTK